MAEGSAGHSTVIGRQQQLSAPAAALCNGTAIHGFELDDLIAESITHPAACVIPAAMAAGEAVDASGAHLLEAIVAGYEVMHRVGLALGVEPAKRGFHTTSLAAPVACAVAAAKVMDLPLDQLISAVGLACSASSGIKSFAAGHGGGMVKRLHLGLSAEAGVRMVQLASRGFLGPPFGLDSRFGMMDVFGGAVAQPDSCVTRSELSAHCLELVGVIAPVCCDQLDFQPSDNSTRRFAASCVDARNEHEIGRSLCDRFERLALERRRRGAPEIVDSIGEQENFDSARAESLKVGRRPS